MPSKLMFTIGEFEAEEISRPPHLIEGYVDQDTSPQVDLTAEQHQVRETVKKTPYPGKTYNSLENICPVVRGNTAGAQAS